MTSPIRRLGILSTIVLGISVAVTGVVPEQLSRIESARAAVAEQAATQVRSESFSRAKTTLADLAEDARADHGRTGTATELESLTVRLKDAGSKPALAFGARTLAASRLVRLDSRDRSTLRAQLADATERETLDRLDSWYTISIPAGADADAVIASLEADPNVAEVFVPLEPSLPQVDDLVSRQGYRRAAPEGIGIGAAADIAGGRGENVAIIDIEFGWDTRHEDLERVANGLIAVGTPTTPHGMDDTNHGTAVVGQIIGTPNGFGVTGLAPGARVGMVNATSVEYGYRLAHAISVAVTNSQPGDVILLEQQMALTRGGSDYVPVEYDPSVFDAIVAATNAGRIVIEAAGNGYQDLDALGIGARDSGAIMVGAGQVDGCRGNGSAGNPRSRADFSNYGSRVDVQGWGECVVTTGYGDLYNDGVHRYYTSSFSGTSSASPIVASAAGILSSIVEASTGRTANPLGIRKLLKQTGTPQDNAVRGHIGPMPNLAAAIDALGLGSTGNGGGNEGGSGGTGGGATGDGRAPQIDKPKVMPAAGYQVGRQYVVPVTVSWSAADADGIGRYAVKVKVDGGAWQDVELSSATATSATLDLKVGRSYRFTVNARDGAGAWGEWATGAAFTPWYYADDSEYVTYSGSWRRVGWDAAEGGEVTVSAETGAWASFSFSGRGVAWIASMGTTRGEADIWLDGEYVGRVDLGSQDSLGRVLAFTARVSPDSRHELVIAVAGTNGRPKIDLDGIVVLK